MNKTKPSTKKPRAARKAKKTVAPDLSFLDDSAQTLTAKDELLDYVHALEKMDAEVLLASDRLSEIKARRENFVRNVLPLAMQGFDEIKLEGGKSLTIKEKLYAKVPEDPFKKQAVFKWLRKNGGGPKIQKELVVDDPSEDTIKLLSESGVGFTPKEFVHPASLTAFLKEVLGLKKNSIATVAIADVPKELNLFIVREAELG